MGKPVPPESGLVPRVLGRTVGGPLPLMIEPVPRVREKEEGMRVRFDEVEPVPLRLGRVVGRGVSLEEEPNRDTVVPPVRIGVLGKDEEDEAPVGPTILPEPEVRSAAPGRVGWIIPLPEARPAVPVGVEWITPLPEGSPVKSGR